MPGFVIPIKGETTSVGGRADEAVQQWPPECPGYARYAITDRLAACWMP